MSQKDLVEVLSAWAPMEDPRVLIGAKDADDAGVYLLDEQTALVFTTDFFTPVVDDPYAFGQIAVANALSDLYAKGVDPLLALNLVGFPAKKLPLHLLSEILRGGADKAREAGVVILGGHTVDDLEPKYGLAVLGFARPEEIIPNSSARPGDRLILTKPLGLGIITTGIKRERVSPEIEAEAVRVMTTLNRAAAHAMRRIGVRAATDVTGYGLLGHLRTMLAASGVSATIWLSRVPVLAAAWELVAERIVPGGTLANHAYLAQFVDWDPEISEEAQLVLCDAQTSGGILIAVPPEKVEALCAALEESHTLAAAIGEVTTGAAGRIRVLP